MDFNKLVNKLYQIEPTDVRHLDVDIRSLMPSKTQVADVQPNMIAESYNIKQGTLREGIPNDLSSFLKMAGVSSKKHLNEDNDLIVAEPGKHSSVDIAAIDHPVEIIRMDIPFMIKLLEFAREEAESDEIIHEISSKIANLASDGKTLTMDDYSAIIGFEHHEDPVDDVKESISAYLEKAYAKYESRNRKNGRIS